MKTKKEKLDPYWENKVKCKKCGIEVKRRDSVSLTNDRRGDINTPYCRPCAIMVV